MEIVTQLIVIVCCLALVILAIKQWTPGGRIIQFPLEVGATLLGITFAINVTLVELKQDFSVNTYMPTTIQNWFGGPEFRDNSSNSQTTNQIDKRTANQTTHNQQNDYSSTDNSSRTWLQSLAQQTANLFSSGEEKKESASETSSANRGTQGVPTSTVVVTKPGSSTSRFYAIRTGSQGKRVKVRLYDSRARSWLDEEAHFLSKEVKEGSAVQIDGVQAVYLKKRPSSDDYSASE